MAEHEGNPVRPFSSREASKEDQVERESWRPSNRKVRPTAGTLAALAANPGTVCPSKSPVSPMTQGRWMGP